MYNQWHQADVAHLRQRFQWIAAGTVPPTFRLPTPEQIHQLAEEDQLYEPLPPSDPNPDVSIITAALDPIATLQGSQPLDAQPQTPAILTAITTAVTTATPPITPLAQLTMATPLCRVPPTIFDGTRSKSESFR